VRRSEQRVKSAAGVNDENDRRVSDRIVFFIRSLPLEENTQAVSELADLVQRTRDTEAVVTEVTNIFANHVRRVSRRVHTDEHDTR